MFEDLASFAELVRRCVYKNRRVNIDGTAMETSALGELGVVSVLAEVFLLYDLSN